MARTTIELSDDLKAALATRAAAEGRSESDVVREALADKLHSSRKPTKEMLFGIFESQTTTTSGTVDDVLTETGFGTT